MTYSRILALALLGLVGSTTLGCKSKSLSVGTPKTDGGSVIPVVDGPAARSPDVVAAPDVVRVDAPSPTPIPVDAAPDLTRVVADLAPPDLPLGSVILQPDGPRLDTAQAPDVMPPWTPPVGPDGGSPPDAGTTLDGLADKGADVSPIFHFKGADAPVSDIDAPTPIMMFTDAGPFAEIDSNNPMATDGNDYRNPNEADGGFEYGGDANAFLPRLALGLTVSPGGGDAGAGCQGTCVSGQKSCQGLSVGTCGYIADAGAPPSVPSTSSYYVTDPPCSNACVGGACTGVCSPGQRRCGAGKLEACDNGGNWTDKGACPLCGALNPGGACPSPAYCASAKCCEALLRPPTSVPNALAGTPQKLLGGDFDADGKGDLIFGRYDDGTNPGFGFLKGRGDGTFDVARLVPAPIGLGNFERGTTLDLNGDGKLDLITMSGGNQIATFLGVGDGTFTGPKGHSFDGQLHAFAVADLDGDRKPDLAALATSFFDGYRRGLVWFRGVGDGTFSPGSSFDAGCNTQGLLASDLDGDGKSELIVWNNANIGSVSTIRVEGGALKKVQQRDVAAGMHSFFTGRIDGDTLSDLVLVFENHVEILINAGGTVGTFKPAAIVGAVSGYDAAIALGDIDGDGVLDLVIGSGSPGNLTLLKGHGDGTFAYHQGASTIDLASLSLADFNGDGRTDIATIGRAANGAATQVLMFRTTLSCN